MMTWTLYLLLALPSGEWGFVNVLCFTSPHSPEGKRAEQFVVSVPQPASMRLAATVCKESIDV